MAKRQFMIEIWLDSGHSRTEAFAKAEEVLELDGLVLDDAYGATPLEPVENKAVEIGRKGKKFYLVRGMLDDGFEDALRAIDQVVNVYEEGRIEHFEFD